MKKTITTNRNSIYKIQVKLTEGEYRKFQEDYGVWHPAGSESEKLKSESNYFRYRYMSGELLRRGAPRGNQNAKRNEVDSANSIEVTGTNLEKINNLKDSTDLPAILTNKDVLDAESASLKNADDTFNKNCGNTENEEANFPSGYDAAEKPEAGKVDSQNVFPTILDEELETLVESIDNLPVINSSASLRDESKFAAKQDSPQQIERENAYPINKIPFYSAPSSICEADANDSAAIAAAEENNSTKKADYQPEPIVAVQPSLF